MVEVPGLKWDKDDTKDQMLGRALTYLVLYSTLGMMVSPIPEDISDPVVAMVVRCQAFVTSR